MPMLLLLLLAMPAEAAGLLKDEECGGASFTDVAGRALTNRITHGEACAQFRAEALQLRQMERQNYQGDGGYSDQCGFEPLKPVACLDGQWLCSCNTRATYCRWMLVGC